MIWNSANTWRRPGFGRLDARVLLPLVLWALLPFGKAIAFYIAAASVAVGATLALLGYSPEVAARRLRRLAAGRVAPGRPFWMRRGW